MKIWGSPIKIRVSDEKFGISDEKSRDSNENLGVSNVNPVVSDETLWVSNIYTPMMMISSQTNNASFFVIILAFKFYIS